MSMCCSENIQFLQHDKISTSSPKRLRRENERVINTSKMNQPSLLAKTEIRRLYSVAANRYFAMRDSEYMWLENKQPTEQKLIPVTSIDTGS